MLGSSSTPDSRPRPATGTSPQPITYETTLAFWEAHLWPNKPESLRPLSSMRFEGGFDPSIKERYGAVYFGQFVEGRLVGVNSGHFSSPEDFRSRGLCVLPEFRRRGYGIALLEAVIRHGLENGATRIWSYPKESAMGVYEKKGFRLTERRLQEEDLNRYAYLELKPEA